MSKIISMIAERFGLTHSETRQLIRSAPHRYKVFTIPKREVGKTRTIAQPAQEIKALQRWLVEHVLSELPVHDAATAYRDGRGIRLNAKRHSPNSYLLKMDFEKYFPSINKDDLKTHLEKYLRGNFESEDLESICQIALWRPTKHAALELCIGGPSSPLISNTIAFDFDVLVHDRCARVGVTYTRYADDLAFSTSQPNVLRAIEEFVISTCQELDYPKLRINEAKTVHTSKKHKRFVTGIVLNNEGKLSLGRERKRQIRAALNRARNSLLDENDMARLRGHMAFAKDIDPDFYRSMCKKYGEEFIRKLLRWGAD